MGLYDLCSRLMLLKSWGNRHVNVALLICKNELDVGGFFTAINTCKISEHLTLIAYIYWNHDKLAQVHY